MDKKIDTPAEVETVTVTMSRPVAEAVQTACEMYLRLHMGQFNDLAEDLCMAKHYADVDAKRFRAIEDENDSLFQALDRRNAMQDDMERSYKMFACHPLIEDGMRVPYRAETVWLGIRHALAWHDKPEGDRMNVCFDKPLNRSDQPQPKIELNLHRSKERDERIKVGDLVYSKILKTAGTVLRADPDDYIIADFDMRNGSSKRYACEWDDLVLVERKSGGNEHEKTAD